MKGSVAHGKSEAERVVICGECRGGFVGVAGRQIF